MVKNTKIKKDIVIVVISVIVFVTAWWLWSNVGPGKTVSSQEIKEGLLAGKKIINPKGDRLIKDTEEYQIFYLEEFDLFLISILKTPFEEIRKKAEDDFLSISGGDKKVLCEFNIEITTPYFVNPDFAGQKFSLSFCE